MNSFSKLGKKAATLGAISVFFIMAPAHHFGVHGTPDIIEHSK
jgi:hypothetical protein